MGRYGELWGDMGSYRETSSIIEADLLRGVGFKVRARARARVRARVRARARVRVMVRVRVGCAP